MGLRSPYSPFRAASARPPCGGRRRLWDFRTSLRFCFAGSYKNFKNRKFVARTCRRWHRTIPARAPRGDRTLKNGTVAPRSPHNLCAASARKRYGLRTIAVWRLRKLHGNSRDCTISVQSPRSLCTDLPRPAPEGPFKKSHDACRNVNTYAVARSHLRCPKNRTLFK